ncbi:FAD-dependent oxidoreductase [Seleniivibrio sp.]|uniref:FAD-dependent oxidoreductase n=1 Tax=Seleniivibrio sp. TaxID=2898801 RepID=UPI0025F0D780|nr:FAD-dependent oxidoreductase [Seleniivibrio sp.]MCD8554589.1 FAD-binding protein [Seleniivibrio sp.]
MNSKNKKTTDMSRRSFMKTSAMSALGVASASLISGVAPEVEAKTALVQSNGKYGFETPPSPIPSRMIREFATADVIVVGGGISGVMAAKSAQENGAKVIVLQKGPVVMCHGFSMGCIDSKIQIEKNIRINKMNAITELNYQSLNKPKFELLKLWAEHSGETFNWIDDMTTKHGVKGIFIPNAGTESGESGGKYWFNSYCTGHKWKGGMIVAINLVAKEAVKAGVEFRFNTPGKQLVQDKSGRITGVIAKHEITGDYIQFNAKKGVILCTGDYGNNPDMLQKYCPAAVGLKSYYTPRHNTGDGHLMGIWVGAEMENGIHTKMAHVHSTPDFADSDAPGRGMPWLAVQKEGKRLCNEDIPFYLMANQTLNATNPDGLYYNILDSDWEENLKQFPPRVAGAIDRQSFDEALSRGLIIKADKIEELANKLNLPAETFSKTVARYNELVEKGVDEDFGKIAVDLSFIKKAPFYGIPRLCCISAILGGININTKMQVLDKEQHIIHGLYAAGNVSGGFFGGANDYPFPIIGLSVGRATTFGRLAGRYAAKG